jgi:beta-N-acetylhexosaminidase
MVFCTSAFTNDYTPRRFGARAAAAAAFGILLLLAGCAAGGSAASADGAAGAGPPAAATGAGDAGAVDAARGGPGPRVRPHVTPPPARYPAARDRKIEEMLSAMSLEEQVAQLLVVELSSPGTGRALTALDPAGRRRLERLQPGGIVLYGGNIERVEQVRTLIADAQRTARVPLFVAIDEEGGLVSRLRHLGDGVATRLPSAARVGAAGDPLLAYRAGRVLGRELRSLGFNLNFAPVVDVAPPGANPFLTSRTFSGDPELVARLGAAVARGLQNHGVAAAAKHFPGHGSAEQDSHYSRTTATASAERLAAVDWLPFRAVIEAGIDGLMVGHLAVPSLTGDETPASVSAAVLGAARQELGFDGLLISDAVTMGGLADALGERNAAVAVVEAGGDIVLTPAQPERAHEAILAAVRSGRIPRRRIEESVRRVLRVKLDRAVIVPREAVFERRFRHVRGLDPLAVLAAPAHRELLRSIEARARGRAEVQAPAAGSR